MIKVMSGFAGPGGSTVALNNLVNLFNDNGLDACFYTHPLKWEGINCKWESAEKCNFSPEDSCVYHYIDMQRRPNVKKLILSCHETQLFPVKEKNVVYDDAHFVSTFQKDWHGVDGVVIPNIVKNYAKVPRIWKKGPVAGIIGSIDSNKRVHLSIEKALEDGHTDIRLYGAITEGQYFNDEVLPLLGDKVSYRGISVDMQSVYDILTDVYHSPLLETFNLIKAECEVTGIYYHGNEGNDTQAEYWDDKSIFEAWKKLLT